LDLRLEIAGDRIACTQDGREVVSASLQDFLALVRERGDQLALPDAIPQGVRFILRRGEATALVIEEPPVARSVRWIAADSPAPKGARARYETVRLAFPFVVLVVVFQRGRLTDVQQCFYRAAPLRTLDDPVCYPNLLNVRDKPSQECWLCLNALGTDLASMTWEERVRALRSHLWSTSFTRSVEMGGRPSYWELMRDVDPRVADIRRWAEETRKDPLFVLGVRWRPTGRSVGEAMTRAVDAVTPPAPRVSATSLASQLLLCPLRPGRSARSTGQGTEPR
jgi:hypothetical protein